MSAKTETLMARLFARGVALREPAQERDILAFESAMDLRLCASAREIYSHFNGFMVADHQSQIFLWGLDEIARRNSAETELRNGSCIAVGDLLIDSDFLVTDLSRPAPVTLLFERREVELNLFDLVLRLSAGRFDLSCR